MTRVVCLVVALAGCDVVFGLERPDAPPPTCEQLTEHDEDHDGVRDGCDNCPGVANPDQNDLKEIENGAAQDGVGDVCDPRPKLSNDYVFRFHTFEPETVASWQRLDGSWSVMGDAYVYDGSSYDEYGSALDLDAAPPPPFTLEARIAITEVLGNPAGVGLLFNADASGEQSTTCSLDRHFQPATNPDMITAYHPQRQNFATVPMLAPGTTYRLTGHYDPPRNIACSVVADDGYSNGTTQDFAMADQHPVGAIGVDAKKMKGAFEYLIVYARR